MPKHPARLVGPRMRKDAAPPCKNPIRRFREELRLTRTEFADLVGAPYATVRTWEMDDQRIVMPRTESFARLMKIAERNKYPLDLTEVHGYVLKMQRTKEKTRGRQPAQAH